MKAQARSESAASKSGEDFQRNGFQIIKSVCDASECDFLSGELTILYEAEQHRAKSKIGGVRNLLRSSRSVATLATSDKILDLLQSYVGACRPVRALFFDKNPQSNWSVPWHQDLAIAVAARREVPGFAGWSIKDGVLHVHPPAEVLEKMVTLRLHLDDCHEGNGPLKVIPGSHLAGRLDSAQTATWVGRNEVVLCQANRGNGLLMRPLLLHASSPAVLPSHRRVLHIEYSTAPLPQGLEWFEAHEF